MRAELQVVRRAIHQHHELVLIAASCSLGNSEACPKKALDLHVKGGVGFNQETGKGKNIPAEGTARTVSGSVLSGREHGPCIATY